MRPHYKTGDEVLRSAWDESRGGLVTVPGEATEFSIELNAADGDSVTTYRRSMSMSAGEQNCTGMTVVCLYGEGVVSVSPVMDADEWYVLTLMALEPKAICAMRIKLEGTGKLVLNG